MDLKKFFFLSGLAIVMMATTQIVLASETGLAPVESGVPASNLPSAAVPEMQWAWGEVTSLDSPAQTVTLKYLDYETDQEKDLVLTVDEKTTFENIKDFSELKINDTLSVDYMVGADNRNIAKNISFEKPELPSAVAENAQPPAATPVADQASTVVVAPPAVATPAAPVTQEAPAVPVAKSEVPAGSSEVAAPVEPAASTEPASEPAVSAEPAATEAPAAQDQAQ